MVDFEELAQAMGDLDEDTVVESLNEVMADDGKDAQKAMEACQKGMDIVGDQFSAGEYFVGDLIYAGELMTEPGRKGDPPDLYCQYVRLEDRARKKRRFARPVLPVCSAGGQSPEEKEIRPTCTASMFGWRTEPGRKEDPPDLYGRPGRMKKDKRIGVSDHE